jgi:hypothetical protein
MFLFVLLTKIIIFINSIVKPMRSHNVLLRQV